MSPYYTEINLDWSGEVAPALPYKLYRYDDFDEYEEAELDCVPILFLPGNRGGHKQARSIGALLALDEFKNANTCFKVYSIDFLDEASALSAKTLEDQARWARKAVGRVRELHKPKSLVLIGHSMGGILSRMLAAGETIPRETGHDLFIITLASPHKVPAINVDQAIDKIYSSLHQPQDLPLIVSIGGGSADLQVLQEMVEYDGQLTVDTEALRYSWCSPDHRAIVWEASITRYIGDLLTTAFHNNSLKNKLRSTLVAFINNS